jgi:phosphate uptake regulator
MLEEIKGGFRILASEVLQAATEARDILRHRDPSKSRSLYHRASYISTQVASLQTQTMELALGKSPGYRESLLLQGLSSIASRLERISDMLLNLDRQAGYLSDPGFMAPFRLDDFFQEILYGLSKIHQALIHRDVSLAVRLGQAEEKLDSAYADRFSRIIEALGLEGQKAGDLVTALMIVHYLERIGDILLEIGEKIIYVTLGEKIKLEQFKALGAGLKATGSSLEPARLDFRSIWGGRSGCRIGVIGDLGQAGKDPADQTVLFKHGPAYKMELERQNLELWSKLRPGLTPAVKAYIPARGGDEAALMLEYVPSRNLQSLFMENVSEEAASRGLKLALSTMGGLWRETVRQERRPAEFARQAESRLAEAATLYPQLINYRGSIGRLEIKSLSALLPELRELERELPGPFSVRAHGDFNLSNILYDPVSDSLRVVDLYRSQETDYVQDVSVLLVSIIRLPIFDPAARSRLNQAAALACLWAQDFAGSLCDATYQARLAFGLARSFLTSTRFVMDQGLAAQFVARARFLWDKLIWHSQRKRPWESFFVPKEILAIHTG